MRLTQEEVQHIVDSFKSLPIINGALYLFGSRVDPQRKGGDIDLLVMLDDQNNIAAFPKLQFIVELKKRLGDRKIDITIAEQSEIAADPFLQLVMPTAVRLV